MLKKKRFRIGRCLAGVVVAGALFIYATNAVVLRSAEGRIYTRLDSVPFEPVALVLGTSPMLDGHRNAFFERRMDAAAELYKAGKVRKLLVSGDHGTREYDETSNMSEALESRGVPARDIVRDDAGFRTLDSVVRAHTVFGLRRCTIVTDDFHIARALYIAQQRGLDAIGFQTVPTPHSYSPWTFTREIGARALVWIDLHVLNRQPRFTGPPEPIRV